MRRPGFLAGYEGITPRVARRQLSGLRGRRKRGFGFISQGFAGFGKAYAPSAPPPPDPNAPITPSNLVKLDDAINARNNNWYMQDIRCPPGEKMVQRREPCKGAGCDPGEIDIYSECDDDPAYRELPPPPIWGFRSCEERTKAGYPAPCTKEICPSCFAPPAMMMMPGMMAPGMMPGMMPGMFMEEMEEEIEGVQTSAGVPIGPEYTGGGAPSVPERALSTGAQTAETKLEKLVEAFEEKKVMARYVTPGRTFIRRGGPSRGPRGKGPAPKRGPPGKKGFMQWVQGILFG